MHYQIFSQGNARPIFRSSNDQLEWRIRKPAEISHDQIIQYAFARVGEVVSLRLESSYVHYLSPPIHDLIYTMKGENACG